MEITGVEVLRQDEKENKAFVTITIDHEMVIRGLRVIDGDNGLFVRMPAGRTREGTFVNIAEPLPACAEYINHVVLQEYQRTGGEGGSEGAGVPAPLPPDPPTISAGSARSLADRDRHP